MNATLKRTAQLGLLARDLAAVRGRSAGPKRDEARRRLVDRLGLLHGLPQKIGQLLAFSEIEASDPAFTKLTENEPSLSGADASAEVVRQLEGPLETFFSAFSPRGIAASVGQVHRATLIDGREVAVKIQHPGIATTIEYDLRALGWLTAPVGDIRRGFDLKAYRAEIGESLRREVDYRSEASSLNQFTELARTLFSPIALPAVVPELSNEKLLVTTWLEGETLAQARLWPQRDRAARFVASLVAMRNAERQTELLNQQILPLAQQALAASRQSYATGTVGFADLIDAQRTLIDVRYTLAEARVERETQLAELEALAGTDVEALARPTPIPSTLPE